MDRQVLDWMQHGNLLREELSDKARWLVMNGRMSPAEELRLGEECEHRRRVMMALRGYKIRLTAADVVWRDYMVAHARLQVDRRSGLIDEREFLTRCYALIDERDLELKGLTDGKHYSRRAAG